MEKPKYVLSLILALTAFVAFAQNNPPIAVDDFDSTGSGFGGITMVLTNDNDPDGDNLTIDTIIYDPSNGSPSVLGGFVIDYTANTLFYGVDTVYYVVCDDGIPSMCDTGRLIVEVTYVLWETYEFLDINNVNARFNAYGSDFWDHQESVASFEVPKGGGRHTLFMSNLWIGGKDAQDSLHLMASTWGSGKEIFTGPLMDTSAYSFSQDSLWNRLWKVNKSEIESHIANWQTPGYTPPEVILNWPAHGNTLLGQAAFLAPFIDRNGDHFYNPYDGDYPKIRGDQAIYFIRNDHRGPHEESGGKKIEIEIHGMAYAYDSIQDYGLNHTIFVHYKMVNRSTNTYTDTYLGVNFDPDIGSWGDDFIECDVKRGTVVGYNSDSIDGSGAPDHYGAFPPAQALVFLNGPLMDADGIDNASGNCDASLNGFGFGDAIIDNESLGMTHFTSHCVPGSPGCNGAVQGNPEVAGQYYNLLMSKWKDGTQMMYGGNAHTSNCTSCEPTNFMFPNVSDTCHLGTMGIVPGDTIPWNEQNSGNVPGDRRGITSTGPFTFSAGDTIEFDIAYVYARDTINPDPYGSALLVKEQTDSIESFFFKTILPRDTIELGGSTRNLDEVATISLFPNPAKDYVKFEIAGTNKASRYQIFDLTGRLLQKGTVERNGSIGIKSLPEGVFIIEVSDGSHPIKAKFIKL